MTRADALACVRGVAQLPMRTRLPQYTYADLLALVARQALADAAIDETEIDGVLLGLAPTPMLGIDEPQYWALQGVPGASRFLGRVHGAAASGLTAFRLACSYVAAGRARCVLVLAADLADEGASVAGAVGALQDPFIDTHTPRNAIVASALQMSGYMALHGVGEREMAHVIVKNRANGVGNEYAQLREAVTLDDVLASPVLAWPVKRLDSSPRTSGAAAVVVGRAQDGAGAHRPVWATGFGMHGGVRNIGAGMVPGNLAYFDGAELAVAARQAYAMAGVDDPRRQIDVAEVYAAFGVFEMIAIEALGLSDGPCAARGLELGRHARDGALPVNPSGGATCGSPISATGLIRVVEAVLQLRGEAGARQIAREPRRAAVSAIGGTFQCHEVGVLQA